MPRSTAVVAALLCVGVSACAAPGPGLRRPAPVMGFEGAGWLERGSRAAEERPDLVLEALGLEPGQRVADLGCGSGYFARRMAALVAPGGRVYCVDVQPEMLELAGRLAARDGVELEPVLATDTDPGLPSPQIDRALLVDVYHELQQPRAVLEALRAALAPGGRVALVEYRLEGDTARHIKLEHRMSPEQVLAEWEPAGFRLVERIETLPSQHLFLFEAEAR